MEAAVTFTGEVQVVDDVPAAFADLVIERAPRSIALSGGGTAQACYEALAARGPDWSGVDVFLGDERFVPVSDADSNEGMVRRVLVDRVGYGTLHSMADAGPTPDAAAAAYDAELAEFGPIDLVHLGLGPDGHTASIFPGSPTLTVADRLVVTAGDGAHPHPRITFTYPAIARAALVVVTVAGREKRAPFARVRAGDESLPAARVRAAEVLWLADPAAAG
jgi:6-phosphogluconolactonase